LTVQRFAGRGLFTLVLGSLVASLPVLPLRGEADKADPRVYAVDEKVEGKTYAEWSAAWWQWACGVKKDRNPVLDRTGAFAAEGQAGPVWFLAGNVGGKTVRKAAVPAGKPLLLPVINYCETAAPEKADEQKLRALAKAEMDRATGLEVTLDGKRVTGLGRFRVASGLFTIDGLDRADAPFEDAVGKVKAVSDGYWIMLRPLSPGKHTLRSRGRVPAVKGKEPFELDVTYELTVAEK
jgi:hypothetical protein